MIVVTMGFNNDTTMGPSNAISCFLTLLELLPTVTHQIMEESLIDCSKYIMMTFDHCICVLE